MWYHELLPWGNWRAFHYCLGRLHQSASDDFHIRLQPNHAIESAAGMGLAQELQLVPALIFLSHTPWWWYLKLWGRWTIILSLNWPTILLRYPFEVSEHLARHPLPFSPLPYVEQWSCWWLDSISCWSAIDHGQYCRRSIKYVTLISNASNTWREPWTEVCWSKLEHFLDQLF